MTAHPSEPPCPKCGYGQPWGVVVQGAYDGVLIWQCPSCRHAWPRFTTAPRHKQAMGIIKEWEAAK